MTSRKRLLLMLEDEIDRLERFELLIDASPEPIEFRHWRTAASFINGFAAELRTPTLICLDHDLFKRDESEPDPGDGRDVASYLAGNEPSCHVIIHSSNVFAADSMFYTLSDSSWDVEKIAPLGHDWIESYWWPIARAWLELD